LSETKQFDEINKLDYITCEEGNVVSACFKKVEKVFKKIESGETLDFTTFQGFFSPSLILDLSF
jgi:hypothetical protein